MGYKSLTQIALMIIALVVIFTYIKPTFISMNSLQDEVFQYADASDKADQLNNQLEQLVATERTFPKTELVALETYLPSAIDSMQVMADIATMAEQSGVHIDTLSSGDVVEPEDDLLFEGKHIVSDNTTHQDFKIDISGSYESLKEMISMMEQNKYPLEVVEFTFGALNEDDTTDAIKSISPEGKYSLTLRTYAYTHSSNKTSS